jgi:two-component system NtrC family sensor kinase
MKGRGMNLENTAGHKQVVLRLRWATIIITSYLILFSHGIDFPRLFPSLLILFYLLSNVIVCLLPTSYFTKLSFFYIVLLFDTFMVSLGIYITSGFETDFYLVYFLIILFATIARSFKLLVVNALVICGISGWFLWTKGLDMKSLEEGILLRIPFIFIMNIFYGFLIQSFEERAKKIKMELKELEESEQRYRQIVESAHDAVAILDEEQRIKFFNKRLVQLTQYAPEELTGMEWAKLVNELDRDKINKSMALKSDLAEEGPIINEVEVFQKNGGKRKVEVSAAQFLLPMGKGHTIFYLKDITEKRQMEERLIRSERLSAIGELISGVAHELNNPLTSVVGYSQLFMKEIKDDELKKDAEAIAREASRASRIVRNLLTFARNQEPIKKMVDLNEIIERTIELRAYELKVNNIQVIKNLDSTLPSMLLDPHKMQQLFLNLINNAEQAMTEALKGGKLNITTCRKGDDRVCIQFLDDGPGIPRGNLNRIFEPFFTTKGEGKGTGLGLSISYGIVGEHGGEIWAESEVGNGASFFIELPILTGEVAKRVKANLPKIFNVRGRKGLIIDDEVRIIDMLSKYFEAEGCITEMVSDGELALKKLDGASYDFILCDIKMPGMDGMTFYQKLKEGNSSYLSKIIFTTGDVVNPDTQEFLKSIKNPVLSKPFDLENIQKSIQQLFNSP